MSEQEINDIKKETPVRNQRSLSLIEFWELLAKMEPPERKDRISGQEKDLKNENLINAGFSGS